MQNAVKKRLSCAWMSMTYCCRHLRASMSSFCGQAKLKLSCLQSPVHSADTGAGLSRQVILLWMLNWCAGPDDQLGADLCVERPAQRSGPACQPGAGTSPSES